MLLYRNNACFNKFRHLKSKSLCIWGQSNLISHFKSRTFLTALFVFKEPSPLGTGDSGVSHRVADATGTRFLSSWRFVGGGSSHYLSSLPPSVSTTESPTKNTWRRGNRGKTQRKLVRRFFSVREEQRQHVDRVNECLKVSVGVLWVVTTFFSFFFFNVGNSFSSSFKFKPQIRNSKMFFPLLLKL